MAETNSETNEKVIDRPTVVRNATDLQRLKLEKLMKNPVSVLLGYVDHFTFLFLNSYCSFRIDLYLFRKNQKKEECQQYLNLLEM